MERDEEVPEWEKSKENVQPRKHGRCADILNSGLSARSEKDTSTKLKLEKEYVPELIRNDFKWILLLVPSPRITN